MYRMNSVLKTRLHGFVLTHDGGRLFNTVLGGLVLAWTVGALIATGAFCAQEMAATNVATPTTKVVCEADDSAAPGALLRCVIDTTATVTRDI